MNTIKLQPWEYMKDENWNIITYEDEQQSNWINKAVYEICMNVKRYSDTRYLDINDAWKEVRKVIEKYIPKETTKLQELLTKYKLLDEQQQSIEAREVLEDLNTLLT